MFRLVLALASLGLLTLALLTFARVPDWAPWRLAVLAGEYGHWLAIAALGAAGAAWLMRGERISIVPAVAMAGAVLAGVLFVKPSWHATQIARRLPAQLERAFGHVKLAAEPFSMRRLFAAAPRDRAEVTTHRFSGELALDFYGPPAGGRPVPCVIVVHGGGWDSGDRNQLAPFNHWLAHRGVAVAAVSYRLAPAFRWPTQRDDVLAAIAWLKGNAQQLGIDATRLVLLGRSAGGQIAQTVAYTANDSSIRGVIGLYAPADLVFGYENTHENDALKSPALMRQFLGGTPTSARAVYESASAHYHAKPGVPPTLLLHGRNDTLVWHRHSERLEARLAEAGVPRAFVLLPWATHAFDYNLNGPGGQLTRFAVEWFVLAVTRELRA